MVVTKSRNDASPWPPGVAAPARRALANAGIETLQDLALRSEAEVATLHGMGPKALQLLRGALQQQGYDFREV
jgi:DNA-directed RNA polymerase alpha subunit